MLLHAVKSGDACLAFYITISFVRVSSAKHVDKLLGCRADKAACGPAGWGVSHSAAGIVNTSRSAWKKGGVGRTRSPHAVRARGVRPPQTGTHQATESRALPFLSQDETIFSRPDKHVCWFIWRSSETAGRFSGIFQRDHLLIFSEKQTLRKIRKDNW